MKVRFYILLIISLSLLLVACGGGGGGGSNTPGATSCVLGAGALDDCTLE